MPLRHKLWLSEGSRPPPDHAPDAYATHPHELKLSYSLHRAGGAGEEAQGQAGKQAFAHRLALVAAGSMCRRQEQDKKKL